jgi:flagellar hook-length control protein FliK
MAQSSANPAVTEATGLAASATLPLTPALGDERWSAALGQQALFMAGQNISSAQLTVNPPNLGPIQVMLDLQHDQASAVFVSPHDAVRQAIEASLPQLRDMFSAAGLNLGNVEVGAGAGGSGGNSAGGQGSAPSGSAARTASAAGSAGLSGAGAGPAQRATRGLLDTFA